MGNYGGSGVGLSTSGDEVNIFDASGTLVTGVGFGTVGNGVSFDNRAGLGTSTLPDPILTTLSVVGVNTAFSSVGTNAGVSEIGSPGSVPEPTSFTVLSLGAVAVPRSSPQGLISQNLFDQMKRADRRKTIGPFLFLSSNRLQITRPLQTALVLLRSFRLRSFSVSNSFRNRIVSGVASTSSSSSMYSQAPAPKSSDARASR